MSFRLVREIGRGGMGCVYEGVNETTGEKVAIKMMSNKMTCYPEYRALFQSEAAALRRMDHPSVVKIVGNPYQDAAGNLYLPMQFIQGKTIEQYVYQQGPMPVNHAVDVMGRILDAIQHIHENKCIHRDIKPSNIMVRDDGSICVIDFGIAKDSKIGSTGKTVGRIIGTDGYMSPEQASGLHIDTRTDIYSLGCLLFFMLTGKPAIETQENEYKTVMAILKTELQLPSSFNSDISSSLDEAFRKATDKNMNARYQSASEFKRALVNTRPTFPQVTVGRTADNDIQITDSCVSSHHLCIRGIESQNTGGSTHYLIEVEDFSKNGTGFDGRKLHHQTETIEYDKTVALPQVMLAGREECLLDWNVVIAHLKDQGWGKKTPPPPPPPLPPKEKLNVGWILLCIFSPLIGFVLWGVWKNEHPTKASQAASWAWAGFIINAILTFLFSLGGL